MKDQKTYKIIGAAMEVHKELGCGFLEAVYNETLIREFSDQGIPFSLRNLFNLRNLRNLWT